ncbi:hypothetical protein [Rosenbergiella collisarenosi]|uniref:SLAC1 family transporter n=1 Tax=Rosenbergiella collisarenosi TaxID=1544695 RepID=UPI0018DF3DE6
MDGSWPPRSLILYSNRKWLFSACYSGRSLFLALSILAILWLRMALHKLPPITLSATTWLALGPIATGSPGMFYLASRVCCSRVMLSSESIIQCYQELLG